MLRRTLLATMGMAVAASFLVAGPGASAAYPERPITIIVPWGAGGGTDATGRILASLMEKRLGVPVTVVNRTGGSGVVGHAAIANAPPDGYTIGVITVETGMMHWAGLTDIDYRSYTPLALYNEDPAGVQVRADSPWNSVAEMLADIRSNPPGTYKASGTGQGGIWHLALAGMLDAAGLESDRVTWVPSQGAAPGLQDLVAGGVDIVTSSVPEAKALIDAGKVKSLAVMAEERNPVFPDVPTLKEEGVDWTLGAWRGIAGPKGLPQEVVDTLVPVLKEIHESKEFRDFMAQRGFGVVWKGPEDFEAFMAERDAALGKVMKKLGLAKG
ncbi:MAG TPA: tripartite tricarboxylate transporter substrate binding protein [Rhodospirillales bacterium]|nr:tripartite tricarboxylate transporter substrate binding protein [Rhodospirillales bacterium]